MKKTRTHCPNCDSQYEYRARECGQCGRKRDQITVGGGHESSANDFQARTTPPIRGRSTSPTQVKLAKQASSFDLTADKTQSVPQTAVQASANAGVTYRPRVSVGATKSSKLYSYLIGTVGAFCLLLYLIALLRGIYNATKPSSIVAKPSVTLPTATIQKQSEGDVDLDHVRFMRAKKERDLKEALEYNKVLAVRNAEERARQSYLGRVYMFGPRGGLYNMDANGKKRYVSSGFSSSSGSRRRGKRR
jgi:hypothetical protein